MRKKTVIALFFLGLLLIAIVERALIALFDNIAGLPGCYFGLPNLISGFLFIGGGLSLIIWSVWFQIRVGKGTPAPMAATQNLVVNGPYAYSRNPMTLGAAAFYLGIGIWYGSLAALFLVLLVFSALLTYIYMHETQELTERFGENYLAYKAKTPFLIAFFWKKKRRQ